MKKNQQLFKFAESALLNAYAPYSKLRVGAAILCPNGHIFSGCNTENISYPCGTCAEAGAIAAMVAAGERLISRILIVSDGNTPIVPCGACLQRIKEFADKQTLVISADKNQNFKVYPLTELLPHAFEEF